MKKNILFMVIPLVLFALILAFNLIFSLRTPITGFQYYINASDDSSFDEIMFFDDNTAIASYRTNDDIDDIINTTVNYTVDDETITITHENVQAVSVVMQVSGYSLEIIDNEGSVVNSYTCQAACAFQVLFAMGETVFGGLLIAAIIFAIVTEIRDRKKDDK